MSLPPEVIAAEHAARRPAQIRDLPAAGLYSPEEVRWARDRAWERDMAQLEKQIKAGRMLKAWAEAHAKRDDVIRAAHDAGVSVHQIHRITGVARTTITRILEEQQ